MDADPLAVPATPQRLRALRDAGVLSEAAYARAVGIAAEPPDSTTQSSFAARGALILAGLLSLASVVFFVAHNWAGMSRWSKFGVLELGLLAFAAAAWRAKGQLTRQLSLTLCAAMLGPLLAVYGQTYQTGADPYELFLTWALLAAPIAALSRFVPLWMVVWGLLNLSLTLAFEQLRPFGYEAVSAAVVFTAALNVAGIAAYVLVTRRTRWLGEPLKWPVRALAVAAAIPPLPLACWFVWQRHWDFQYPWRLAAVATVVALSVALPLVFRSDRVIRSTAAFAACGLGTALAMRQLDVWLDSRIEWAILGVLVVAQTSLAVWWIRGREVTR